MIEYEFHETANAFPYISGDSFESLKEDIRINGILEPIFLYEGKIIDGRNRYRIAKELNLEDVPFQNYEGDNPVGFVQSMNLHRRQLSPSQKAAAAAFLADFRQGKHDDEEEYQTQDAIAKMLGISKRMVVEATSLKKNGDTDLIERVRTGEISLHNATAIARLNPEDQKSIVGEGSQRAKEVAKKIKAMTKGKGRKKKDDPERIIDIADVDAFSLPEKNISTSAFEPESIEMEIDDPAPESAPVKVRKPRGKKIAIEEASDFGHSLIDAIIVLGATTEDADGGNNVIQAALSDEQLSLFADSYNAVELRALLTAGLRELEKLVK
ncbi:ParB/RepB/Spo0J family partition protein [Providencia sp. PROV018]|uniref:ParB/RepB/Spo0J family partition protein n=1 Tax=Providencia sp. PROV018 TaxID=2949753 RepID=UPI00234BBB6C|nr:ParB/RepB/Spo0J family partition protein [Providencia sp. PROV018]